MNTKFLSEMDNLDHALRLAAMGWYVFPCREKETSFLDKKTGELVTLKTKEPRISKAKGGNGYLDGTTDPDKIFSWWERYPGALVGIACITSGLLVLDLDRHEGQPDGVAAFAEISEDMGSAVTCGPSQTTPANGQHLIFKAPQIPIDFEVPAKLAPGIDLRYRHYICTGRLADGRSYQWLPGRGIDSSLTYPPSWVCKIIVNHHQQTTQSKQPIKRAARPGTLSPGDDFGARTDWGEILPPGWRRSGRVGDVEYWTRPGKRAGVSATVNFGGKENLYIFSTNASPFQPEKSYSKFGAYALLKHGGDFSAAARALAAAGYGKQNSSTGSTK